MGARSTLSQIVAVLVTCPNRRVADAVGKTVVEERLAACANIIPGLTSIYRWQGKLCRDREVLVIMKTRRSRFPALARRVRAVHPYTVPEIIAVPVTFGSAEYLAWVAESTI